MIAEKVKHPGRTAAQRRALDEIGCGNRAPAMASATKAALLRAGLIEKCGCSNYGMGWMRVSVQEYQMPIPVHMQWCQAVSGESEDL